MCGIAGIYNKNTPDSKSEAEVSALLNNVAYRGPDNKSIVNLGKACLGHLRLSIIDLSKNANQPMQSASKKGLYIIYNGEIYNYPELKKKLGQKYIFTTHSDTEVILNAYLEWGEDCVKEFNGMWAFAIYDTIADILFCSRDRFGIKPFYYISDDNKFIFASEIKCFKSLKSFKYEASMPVIIDNMIYGPLSFGQTQIKDVFELESGSNLIIQKNKITRRKYFNLEDTFKQKPVKIDLEHLDYLVKDAVNLRLRSDVPVATLNSGGLDSSLISAIAKKNKVDLKTFSVAPDLTNGKVQVGDESEFAQILAKHIDSELITLRYSEKDFTSLLDRVAYVNDGELYHSNSIPLYMLFKYIKEQKITVVLSGEGADEVFRGYSSNFRFRVSKILPKKIFIKLLNKRIKGKDYFTENFDNYRKAISIINSLYVDKAKVEKYYNMKYEILPERKELFYIMNHLNPASAISYFEQKTYLSGLLRRLDRMSMAHSIESRVPFLDHRIVEYMNRVPLHNKIGIKQKAVKLNLKKIARNYIPDIITERTKRGFSTPVHNYSINKTDSNFFSAEESWYIRNLDVRNFTPSL